MARALCEDLQLNDVGPYVWLTDILARMVGGHTVNCLDELLPWVFQQSKAGSTLSRCP